MKFLKSLMMMKMNRQYIRLARGVSENGHRYYTHKKNIVNREMKSNQH